MEIRIKRHKYDIPLKLGLKNGLVAIGYARKDHYVDPANNRIEYEEVASVSTDTEEMGVWG